MTRNDNEWDKECKYKEHLPTCIFNRVKIIRSWTSYTRTRTPTFYAQMVMYGSKQYNIGYFKILEGKMVSQTSSIFQYF